MAELAVLAVTYAYQAYGEVQQGKELKRVAYSEAAQLDDKADVIRAVSQRDAEREKVLAEYSGSRALALAAASGAGVMNVNVLNILAEHEAEGEYRSASRLYAGEYEAEGLEAQAQNLRAGGRAAKRAGRRAAVSTILSSTSTFSDMYGSNYFSSKINTRSVNSYRSSYGLS